MRQAMIYALVTSLLTLGVATSASAPPPADPSAPPPAASSAPQKGPEKPLQVDWKVRGYFLAASAKADPKALGGFGGSDNFPIPLQGRSRLRGTG